MLDSILVSESITLNSLLLCTLTSLVLGVLSAALYMFRSTYTKGFVITLALLPAIVQTIIMLVNGNIGTGVAVMGAFSLIRFRSVPGSAREIGSLFLAMALGLATGMGYLGVAMVVFLLIGLLQFVLTATPFGNVRGEKRDLRITIPESLDYADVFSDLFAKYARETELIRVKTTNMGSLYELQYHITLREPGTEKAFIDDIRCRNGNLTVSCGRIPSIRDEL